MSSSNYLERGITDEVSRLLIDSPVVVLRGARAVGKTRLARRLIDLGALQGMRHLDDPATRAAAESDPLGWLRSQPSPLVLDEAQLSPAVLNGVKRMVDQVPSQRYLLTGSAELPASLGGQDPLAGRSTSLTLHPMTHREIRGLRSQVSTVQRNLFEGSLEARAFKPLVPADRLRILRRGGFPRSAASRPPRLAEVADRVRRVLTADVVGRTDRAAIEQLMRLLAAETAGLKNLTRLARDLVPMKPETLSRYLAILESVYLVHSLAGLRGSARGVAKAQPKIHVVDTSLAFWGLGSSDDVGPEQLGSILETFVANEIRADLGFAEIGYQYFHWRDDRGEREVDLVVVTPDGRRYGFEVKSASTVPSRDGAGLRALRSDGRLDRGFVVYGGSELYEMEPGIWALPLQALWDEPEHNGRSTAASGFSAGQRDPGPGEAVIFFSYVHSDDGAWGGAILQLAEDLAAMFRSETGESVRIFTDRDIRWGEVWRQRIDSELDAATFLVPIVTPGYLKSPACRQELLDFSLKASSRGVLADSILPIIWTMPRELQTNATDGDAVVKTLAESQYVKWEHLRGLSGVERAEELARLARRLQERLGEQLERFVPERDGTDRDLIGDLAQLDDIGTRIQEEAARLQGALERWMYAFEQVPAPAPGADARAVVRWTRRLATELVEPTQEVEEARIRVEHSLSTATSIVDDILRFGATSPAAVRMLEGFLSQLDQGDLDDVEFADAEEIRSQLTAIGAFSKPLRPHITAVDRAIEVVAAMPTLLRGWQRSASGILRRQQRDD